MSKKKILISLQKFFDMQNLNLSEQEQIRRKSLEEIKNLGINPFPAEEFEVNVTTKEIHENYDQAKNNLQDVSFAGRIMSRRIMGNASFAELQDH